MYKIIIAYFIMLFMFVNFVNAVETKDENALIQTTEQNTQTNTDPAEKSDNQAVNNANTTLESSQTTKTDIAPAEKTKPAKVNNVDTVGSVNSEKKTVAKKSKKSSQQKPIAKNTKVTQVNYTQKFHLEDYIMKVMAGENVACSGFAVGKKVALAPFSCSNFIRKNGYKVHMRNQKNQNFQNVSFVNIAANKRIGLASQWVLLITDKEIIPKGFLPSYKKPIDLKFVRENELFMVGIVNVKNNISIQNAYNCKLSSSSIYAKNDKIRTALLVKCDDVKDKNMYIGAALLGINKTTKNVQLLGIKLDTKKDTKTNNYYSIVLPTYAINAVKESMKKEEEKRKVIEL